MTCRPRELAKADAIVERALEVIRYLQPRYWFVENPRTGMLKDRGLLDGVTYVDVDYCQFCDWGYQKPTRIWGPKFLENLRPKVCDWRACPNLVRRSNGYLGHRRTLGATPRDGAPRIPLDDQYRIPRGVISYIFGWDRKDSDWKVPLVFRPPSYPPPPLKTANIQQSTANIPLPEPPRNPLTSKGSQTAAPPFRPEWGPVVGTAKDCSLCAKGTCGTQPKDEWLPASAHNARGRKGQAAIRLTSTEETDHLSAAASLSMGIPKRRRAKARVYTPKSQLWNCNLKL